MKPLNRQSRLAPPKSIRNKKALDSCPSWTWKQESSHTGRISELLQLAVNGQRRGNATGTAQQLSEKKRIRRMLSEDLFHRVFHECSIAAEKTKKAFCCYSVMLEHRSLGHCCYHIVTRAKTHFWLQHLALCFLLGFFLCF